MGLVEVQVFFFFPPRKNEKRKAATPPECSQGVDKRRALPGAPRDFFFSILSANGTKRRACSIESAREARAGATQVSRVKAPFALFSSLASSQPERERERESNACSRVEKGKKRKTPHQTPPTILAVLAPLWSFQRFERDHTITMRHHLPRGAAPRPEKPAGEEDDPRFAVVDAADDGRGGAECIDGDALACASPRTTAAIVYFAIRKSSDGAPLESAAIVEATERGQNERSAKALKRESERKEKSASIVECSRRETFDQKKKKKKN